MRLPHFILANVEAILAEWQEFASQLAPGATMTVVALRDHAEGILRTTARDMLASQTAQQQADKSQGIGSETPESKKLDSASEEHAIARLEDGFDLIEVVAEYRALRASVLRLWSNATGTADKNDLEDLTRFNESIDQSLTEAVKSYTNRLDESRELFLATLGHDLRSPLNAIMLSAQFLAMSGQLDEEKTEIASQMTGFGHVMVGMIHDLLDFTRMRLGAGMPLSFEAANLGRLCEEVLVELRAAHPGRHLNFESKGDLSGHWDEARLRQVVSNLVGNALEHGDRHAIEVVASGNSENVSVAVTNRGPVIAASAIATLFDPFVRATSMPESTARRSGVGLGLYIVREIVTAHGGTIAVTSSEATGTVFTVRLPRVSKEIARGSNVQATPAGSPAGS